MRSYKLPSLVVCLTFAAAMLSLPQMAHAAGPYVFCEAPSLAADKCVVTGHATLAGEYTVANAVYQGRRGALIDVGNVAAGPNSLSAALKSNLWGLLGVAVPFSFTRPTSADLTPAVLLLVPASEVSLPPQ